MFEHKIYFDERSRNVSRLEQEAERVASEVIRAIEEVNDNEEHQILVVLPKPNTWERYIQKSLVKQLKDAKQESSIYQTMFTCGPERVQAVSRAWSGQINGRSYRLEIRKREYYDCNPREIPDYSIDGRIRVLVNPAECW